MGKAGAGHPRDDARSGRTLLRCCTREGPGEEVMSCLCLRALATQSACSPSSAHLHLVLVRPQIQMAESHRGETGERAGGRSSWDRRLCAYRVREENSFPLYTLRLEPRSPADSRVTREKNSFKGILKENWFQEVVRLLRRIYHRRLNLGKGGWAPGGEETLSYSADRSLQSDDGCPRKYPFS